MRKFILLVFIFALTAKEKRFAKKFFTFAQCLNENNEPVDFFYSYKLPRIRKLNLDGYEYSYITSEDVSGGWKHSTKSLKDEENLIARTLRDPMLKSDYFLLAYNDEEPNGPNDDTGGHTKGVFATDGNVGFWMIHSVPKFPDINSFHYPENAVHNGQSFLCISVNSSEIETVGEQLIYNEVNIYGSKIPPKLKGKFPKLEDAIQKKWRKNGPFENLKEFKSLNGTKFLSFAKGRHFNKELYVDWVAPHLQADLLTETWRNGPGALPSNCSLSQSVLNVKDIQIGQVRFPSTVDHSKWAVGKQEPWICVGDINRAEHQEVRGGGTVCLKNAKLAEHYRKLVENYEKCNDLLVFYSL